MARQRRSGLALTEKASVGGGSRRAELFRNAATCAGTSLRPACREGTVINRIFDGMVYYLPVFVPFALAVFSVITRLVSGTMDLKVRNFLKTYTDIVLGIFSFLIWALIAYMQTGRIALNDDLVIAFPKVIILLVMDTILLVTAALVSRHEWEGPDQGSWTKERRESLADTAMIFVTMFFFVIPIFLTSPAKSVPVRAATSRYTVLVPYEDSSIPKHVGAARWAGRHLCEIQRVQAGSLAQAKAAAIARFDDSGRSVMLFSRSGQQEHVTVLDSSIMVRADEVSGDGAVAAQ